MKFSERQPNINTNILGPLLKILKSRSYLKVKVNDSIKQKAIVPAYRGTITS